MLVAVQGARSPGPPVALISSALSRQKMRQPALANLGDELIRLRAR